MGTSRDQPDAALELSCEPASRPILERFDEPINEPGVCCVHLGSPCILFDDWDYAEDWSGEFVRVVAPEPLSSATRVSAEDFWALVRKLHA